MAVVVKASLILLAFLMIFKVSKFVWDCASLVLNLFLSVFRFSFEFIKYLATGKKSNITPFKDLSELKKVESDKIKEHTVVAPVRKPNPNENNIIRFGDIKAAKEQKKSL